MSWSFTSACQPTLPPGIRLQEEGHWQWPGLDLQLITEDISTLTEWQIRSDHHTIVLHLAGRMDHLETELEGHGGGFGPALPGEIWKVPAGRAYASQARGQVIRYAVLSLPTRSPDTDAPLEDLIPVTGGRDAHLSALVQQLIPRQAASIRPNIVSPDPDMAESRAADLAADLATDWATDWAGRLRTHLLDNHTHPAPGRERCHPARLTPAAARHLRSYVAAHLDEKISLHALARQVDLSVHQLLIAFRAAFGTTPAQYLIDQRLRRAAWYLLHTRWDVTAIALRTGFASHSHLTSALSRRYGLPPRSLRRRYAATPPLAPGTFH